MKDLIQEGRHIQDKFKNGFAENVVLKEVNFPKTVEEVKAALKQMGVRIRDCKINKDLTVDVNGELYLDGRKLRNILVKFGEVKGDFNCKVYTLSSLEGSPQIVHGDFNCEGTQIKSLEGAPQIVHGNVQIIYNEKLTSLEGGPKQVGGTYDVQRNSLTSLKGAPSTSNTFICDYNKLTSLEGAPDPVNGHFSCEMQDFTLRSFKGAPKTVKGMFISSNNKVGRPQIEWALKNIKAAMFDFGPENEKYNG